MTNIASWYARGTLIGATMPEALPEECRVLISKAGGGPRIGEPVPRDVEAEEPERWDGMS